MTVLRLPLSVRCPLSICDSGGFPFSRLDMCFPHKMHGFESAERNRGGFLIGHIGRFEGQHASCRQTGVLGISAQMKTGPCKHWVTLPESCDRVADRLNFSRKLLS